MIWVGHRGAPQVAPGNTLASFRAALEAGCDWVECDCRASADGVVVLAHDPIVVDRSGRRHELRTRMAADLAALDLGAGEGVPTLAGLVEWAVGRVGVMADIKEGGLERPIAEALARLPAGQAIVSGADEAGRRRFRALDAHVCLSITVDCSHEEEMVRRWAEIDSQALTLEHPLVTPERVSDLHRRGVRVYPWTVDDLDRMRELAAMGVDGLITNRPDLLARLR